MHIWLFTNAVDIISRTHERISTWVCCYAPDFRTGTFIAVIRRCREVFSRWECGFHWKLCCYWLEGLRRRRVAVIMQGQGIPAHLFIYIYYHMRCYRRNIDLCLYICMGSWFNVLMMMSANVFSFSFHLNNVLWVTFYWDFAEIILVGQHWVRWRLVTKWRHGTTWNNAGPLTHICVTALPLVKLWHPNTMQYV